MREGLRVSDMLSKLRRPDVRGIGWATGELGIACYIGISATYLLFYATKVLGINPAWAGLALLIPRMWNVVLDPIVGWLSDRTRTRFGRRRPYFLGGAILWAGCYALLFNLPLSGSGLMVVLLFGCVFLANNTGLSLYHVPYTAMLAEISQDESVRTKLAAYREMVARVGILAALAGGPWLLDLASSQADGFSNLGIAVGIVIVLCSIFAFFATADDRHKTPTRHSRNLRSDLKALRTNNPLIWLSASYLFVNMGDAMFGGALVFYLTQVLDRSASTIAILYPVSSVVGFLSAPLWWVVSKRLGKGCVCRVAMAMNSLCCLFPLLIGPEQFWMMYPFMAFYGLVNTGARLLPNAMVPDTSDLDRKKTGERREGAIFGVFVFVQQTGFAVGGFILSLILAIGVSEGLHGQTEPSTLTVLLAFTVAAAGLYGMAFAAILRYRIPREYGYKAL